jgi:hypothetical protein
MTMNLMPMQPKEILMEKICPDWKLILSGAKGLITGNQAEDQTEGKEELKWDATTVIEEVTSPEIASLEEDQDLEIDIIEIGEIAEIVEIVEIDMTTADAVDLQDVIEEEVLEETGVILTHHVEEMTQDLTAEEEIEETEIMIVDTREETLILIDQRAEATREEEIDLRKFQDQWALEEEVALLISNPTIQDFLDLPKIEEDLNPDLRSQDHHQDHNKDLLGHQDHNRDLKDQTDLQLDPTDHQLSIPKKDQSTMKMLQTKDLKEVWSDHWLSFENQK